MTKEVCGGGAHCSESQGGKHQGGKQKAMSRYRRTSVPEEK